MGFFSEGLQNECNTAVVNKASVFEPLKVNFMCFHIRGVSIARDVPSLIYQFSRYQELTVVDSFMAKKNRRYFACSLTLHSQV